MHSVYTVLCRYGNVHMDVNTSICTHTLYVPHVLYHVKCIKYSEMPGVHTAAVRVLGGETVKQQLTATNWMAARVTKAQPERYSSLRWGHILARHRTLLSVML